MRVLAALLALVALPATADLIASNGRDEVRLTPARCTHEGIRDRINPEHVERFRAGQASVGGKTFSLCWIDTEQGHYFIAYDDGDFNVLPITIFTEKPGA